MAQLEDKIDKIQEDVGEMKTHMAVYNEQLKIHIKRSDLLEKRMQPVEDHVAAVNWSLRSVVWLSAVATIATLVIEALAFIKR